MATFDLYSKRQKKLRNELPDVYQYDTIPNKLRVQIVHIIRETIGTGDRANDLYKDINNILCKEFGVFVLKPYANSLFESIYNYFLACQDLENVIDIIELSFRVINTIVREYEYQMTLYDPEIKPDDAIQEFNERFKENGVGYQFESNEIIRIDSQFLHSESVKPVLHILGNEQRFKGANEEFLKAFEHYTHGRYKECIVDALNAFESTMKAICHRQKWQYNQNDTAKRLIEICFENKLIPDFLQSEFASLRTLFESGVPTIRNKLGGHGKGTQEITIPESIGSYSLHLTASNILLLVKLEKEIS
jgi:hypothetical protein